MYTKSLSCAPHATSVATVFKIKKSGQFCSYIGLYLIRWECRPLLSQSNDISAPSQVHLGVPVPDTLLIGAHFFGL